MRAKERSFRKSHLFFNGWYKSKWFFLYRCILWENYFKRYFIAIRITNHFVNISEVISVKLGQIQFNLVPMQQINSIYPQKKKYKLNFPITPITPIAKIFISAAKISPQVTENWANPLNWIIFYQIAFFKPN